MLRVEAYWTQNLLSAASFDTDMSSADKNACELLYPNTPCNAWIVSLTD